MTPRWEVGFVGDETVLFRGRAGPLDIWEDPFDMRYWYYALWGDPHKYGRGHGSNAEQIISAAKREGIHLTLLDECRVHQICNRVVR